MAYRLKLREPLERGVRRIAVAQLEKTLSAPSGDAERAVWVHETRKALKRTRALLRLVRSGLAASDWESENRALRDIARMLSPMRDRDILGPVLRTLALGADRGLAGALARFEKRLAASQGTAAVDPAAVEPVIAEARSQIAAARERLASLAVEGEAAAVIAGGCEAGQRRGAKALARVEATPSDANVHDLRKAVQTTWRQMALVEAAWPGVTSARAAAARELAQMLGDVQDLAVLADTAAAMRGSQRLDRDAQRVVAASRARLQELRLLAIPTARRLYAMPPRSAGVELSLCWSASMAVATAAHRKRKAAAVEAASAPRRAMAAEATPRPRRTERRSRSKAS